MHKSALDNGRSFFEVYAAPFDGKARVVEIGSQDVNGGLRQLAPGTFEYVGLDFCDAPGVDVVLSDPYRFPLEDASADILVCSSCLEHSEFFWLVFLEGLRCLKPGGLFYLNVPSTGSYHRFPVDCWRFYPDSGQALERWARRNGMEAVLLESYIQVGGDWNDFVGVFGRDASALTRFPRRILDSKEDFENGRVHGRDEMLRPETQSQDRRLLDATRRVARHRARLARRLAHGSPDARGPDGD